MHQQDPQRHPGGSSSTTTRPRSRPSSRRTCRSRWTLAKVGAQPRPSRGATWATTTPDLRVPDAVRRRARRTGPVEVNAKRILGPVATPTGRSTAAATARAPHAAEWKGGARYGEGFDTLLPPRSAARSTGMRPGDKRERLVQESDSAERARSYTYSAEGGGEPLRRPGAGDGHRGLDRHAARCTRAGHRAELPRRLRRGAHALAGIRSDVYDVDAPGRKAPHPLGVLSALQGRPLGDRRRRSSRAGRAGCRGCTAGTRGRSTTELTARDYINEGGKLLCAGRVRLLGATATRLRLPPQRRAVARNGPTRRTTTPAARCPTTSSSTGWALRSTADHRAHPGHPVRARYRRPAFEGLARTTKGPATTPSLLRTSTSSRRRVPAVRDLRPDQVGRVRAARRYEPAERDLVRGVRPRRRRLEAAEETST